MDVGGHFICWGPTWCGFSPNIQEFCFIWVSSITIWIIDSGVVQIWMIHEYWRRKEISVYIYLVNFIQSQFESLLAMALLPGHECALLYKPKWLTNLVFDWTSHGKDAIQQLALDYLNFTALPCCVAFLSWMFSVIPFVGRTKSL